VADESRYIIQYRHLERAVQAPETQLHLPAASFGKAYFTVFMAASDKSADKLARLWSSLILGSSTVLEGDQSPNDFLIVSERASDNGHGDHVGAVIVECAVQRGGAAQA